MAEEQKRSSKQAPNSDTKEPQKNAPERERVRSSERIDTMREQLYARDAATRNRERHGLARPSEPVAVPRAWETPQKQAIHEEVYRPTTRQPERDTPAPALTPSVSSTAPIMPQTKKTKKYRLKLVMLGLAFFLGALGLSSGFLYFGNNSISGNNIAVSVKGPTATRGGDELSLQVSIANQNAIPIESATLIVDYPAGTQSATEAGKEVFTDRISLTRISPGEVLNVPTRARIFGEENEEKIITIAVEYRVEGSNATFFKEADPYRFKISSSPVVVHVESVDRISAGQEAEITLIVSSNSPSPIDNVLVKATYPFGFDFSESDPSPVAGQNTWRIDTLEPEEDVAIVVKGIVVGQEDEEKIFSFDAGVANERDAYSLASVFANGEVSMTVEQPFLGVDVEINGALTDVVAVPAGRESTVRIAYENTLSDAIYDAVIKVTLTGNAINQFAVNPQGGFYDSSSNTITWDRGLESDLAEILPGRSRSVAFSITPQTGVSRTPEVGLSVGVTGQRVSESGASQSLQGAVTRTIRVESVTSLTSGAYYTDGPFNNSGPVPPVVGRRTQYALNLILQNGSNDVASAVVTAELPPYVEWLDHVTSDDTVAYNPVTRTITWEIGSLDAGERTETWIQVALQPSASQVNRAPVILETQRFRASDRFTGSTIRSDASPLTTELINDSEVDPDDGRVQEDD